MPVHPDNEFIGGRLLRDFDKWLFGGHDGEGGWRNFVWGHCHGAEHLRRGLLRLDRDEFGRAMDHFHQAWNGGRIRNDPAIGRGSDAYRARDGYQGDFRRFGENLGGVELVGGPQPSSEAIAFLEQLKFSLTSLEAVLIEHDKIVLMGNNRSGSSSAAITQDDMLQILLLVYSGQNLSFSLDPWDPADPDGGYYQKVFYPDALASTAIGETLFVTDYRMKQLALGLEQISGLPNEGQIALTVGSGSEIVRARLWISAEDVPISLTDGLLHFGKVKMVCSARRLVLDASSPTGLSDQDLADSTGKKFAEEFTSRYDSIALAMPQFERLRSLAKVVAFTKFLRNAGVEIDVSLVRELLSLSNGNLPSTFISSGPRRPDGTRSPAECAVPRLTKAHSATQGNQVRTVTLSGGVVLAPSCVFIETDSASTVSPVAVTIPLQNLRCPRTQYAVEEFSRVAVWRELEILVPHSWCPVIGESSGSGWSQVHFSSIPTKKTNLGEITMSIQEVPATPDFSQVVATMQSQVRDSSAIAHKFKDAIPELERNCGNVTIASLELSQVPRRFTCVSAGVLHSETVFELQIWLCLELVEDSAPTCLLVSVAGREGNKADITACASRIRDGLLSSLQALEFKITELEEMELARTLVTSQQESWAPSDFELERAIALSLAEHQRHLSHSALETHLQRSLAGSAYNPYGSEIYDDDPDLKQALALSRESAPPDCSDTELARALELRSNTQVTPDDRDYDFERVLALSREDATFNDDDDTELRRALILSRENTLVVHSSCDSDLELALALSSSNAVGGGHEDDLQRAMALSLLDANRK